MKLRGLLEMIGMKPASCLSSECASRGFYFDDANELIKARYQASYLTVVLTARKECQA